MKICTKCHESKEKYKYHKQAGTKDGYRYMCKTCTLEYNKNKNIIRGAEYDSWVNLKKRCYNPKNKDYVYYGEKGVTVCDEWLESYENFLEDMGRKPTKSHSIDRIDSNGNYEPSNCRWATDYVQAQNQGIRKDNKSGYKGVHWCATNLKWISYINSNKTRHSLGHFDKKDDAIDARKQGELKYWNKEDIS